MINWEERFEKHQRQKEDARSEYDADYARIVHSASFRRLQGKTQILNLGEGDFYRTRLTHTLEVSQIATGIVRQFTKYKIDHPASSLFPSDILIQAICLTHDLGHPPFGHGGEVALNYCMRNNGGFEGNGQSLRILTKLERFSNAAGSNLTRRTLFGVLKYPVSYSAAQNPDLKPKNFDQTGTVNIIDREFYKPPKCYLDSEEKIVEWIIKDLSSSDKELFLQVEERSNKHKRALHKSFDCSIMDIADDIAYGVHDLEDAISLKLITEDQFRQDVPEKDCAHFLDKLKEKKYPKEFESNTYDEFVTKLFSDSSTRKRQIGRLVHYFITHVDIIEKNQFQENFLKYCAGVDKEAKTFLDTLQKFIVKKVIRSPNVQHLEYKGQNMVMSVFDVLISEPECFLPNDTYQSFIQNNKDTRIICDYLAGMTDHYLLKTYDRLFSPRMGSIFDRL